MRGSPRQGAAIIGPAGDWAINLIRGARRPSKAFDVEGFFILPKNQPGQPLIMTVTGEF